MANTATLADLKLVLSTPVRIKTKRRGYGKAEVDFVSARMKFIDRTTSGNLGRHRRGGAPATRGSQARQPGPRRA
jgi:hypothetical protein